MAKIIDEQGNLLAVIQVDEYASNRFEGVILSSKFPNELMELLREFEGLANEQALSLLDEVERKIAAYNLVLAERNAHISKLQLWGENGIHFWIDT